jgi:D-3-phosphoglycerate dehydrogenase
MAEANRLGVKVIHLRGQKLFLKNVNSTAELTIALILSALRKLPQAFENTRIGYWDQGSLRGREAAGKLIGIVGCGRLGTKVARVGLALGMHVLVYDPLAKRLPRGATRANSLNELLSVSDIVSLHVPLMPETIHMVGEHELNSMKRGSILVNTSRGAIVDTLALVEALNSGRLASAAVDVVENEEGLIRGEKHILIEYARANTNLLITPHIGGATHEAVEKTDAFIIGRYLKEEGLIS